jgi:predicted nuclease with TOPRIM domain
MTNKLPTVIEYRRILTIAKDNPALASTLNSLRNAWILCDTEYVSIHSEYEEARKELRDLEKKRSQLRNRLGQLEEKIDLFKYKDSIDCDKEDDVLKRITDLYGDDYNDVDDFGL